MGKITSMHFAGWKMGLKTGMYYLRTMAASAPIQFTVDQEQLLVADTNVARERTGPKKRTSVGYHSSFNAVPRPMYAQKNSSTTNANGMMTPTATPPASERGDKQLVEKLTKSRLSDGEVSSNEPSPKVLATDPVVPIEEESLDDKKNQDEDDAESKNREADIYSQKVLACSIENKEACVMCSG